MLGNEKLLFDELYEKTKDCGRVQFVELLMTKERENQELKKQLEEKNKPQIFIDTQDMEERYSEGLYQDYLEEENKKYKEVIDTIKKEVDKIFVEGQIINKCLLLSIYENIWRILKEVSE